MLEQGYRVLIRNISERGGTGKIRSFWDEKVHVVVENINNENITYKVRPQRNTDGRIRVLHRNMLLPSDDLLDSFNWNIKTKPTKKKQNKKATSGLPPMKNDNEKGRATGNEGDGSEMGKMIAFTPREIQIFSKENSDNIEKEEKEVQKVEDKVEDFSIGPWGNEKIISVDDGFEYCETGGRKMKNKDQGGIKRSNLKPLRTKK